jgi:outer membrane scaffolding protein for murein synthesis (MipA/OmpV family)
MAIDESAANRDQDKITPDIPSEKKFEFSLGAGVIMNREGFGSEIKDSPIVEKTSAYAFITSLSYKF